MSLDFRLSRIQRCAVFGANITHNLVGMAQEAGVYEVLWRSDGIKASAVASALHVGIAKMERAPKRFKKFDSPNGWGTYENFLKFCKEVLAACEEYPDSEAESFV